MGFDDMVDAQAAKTRALNLGRQQEQTALKATFEASRAIAANEINKTLAEAANLLIRRGTPTSLAVTTDGPDGDRWHFVAQAQGWDLKRYDVDAFLTVDGRICMEHERPGRVHGFLSTAEVLHRFEKSEDVKPLKNREGLAPGSGRVIDLRSNPGWMEADRLIDNSAGTVQVLWPSSYSRATPRLDFDASGQVWVNTEYWDSRSSTPLAEWLAEAVGRLVAESCV